MKKLLILALLCALVLTLTACGCKHENTTLINAVAATCTTDGYSGDVKCVKCEKILTKGAPISATGHTETVKYAADANCWNTGYTGDTYCSVCNEVIAIGEVIPMLEHVPGDERYNGYEPTCTKDGSTGVLACTLCNSYLWDTEEIIPALGHTLSGNASHVVEATCTISGYTGDDVCTVCEREVEGEVIERLPHNYDANGVCVDCGWKPAGFWKNDELVMSWDDMVSTGYITLDDTTLETVTANLEGGTLIIAEGVEYIDGLKDCNAKEIWIPTTVTYNNDSVRWNETVEKLVVYSDSTTVGRNLAVGCKNLTEVVLINSDAIFEIDQYAFRGCSALTSFDFPKNLEVVQDEAFIDSGLTAVDLPDSVRYIDDSAFAGTKITTFTAPANPDLVLGDNILYYCENLTYIDLSNTTLTELPYQFASTCDALTRVDLPATLTNMGRYSLNYNEVMTTLVLPDGVSDYNSAGCKSLTTVVWPVAMVEVSKNIAYNPLTTIYYRGTETQWQMVKSTDLLPEGVTVIFNYEGDGTELYPAE